MQGMLRLISNCQARSQPLALRSHHQADTAHRRHGGLPSQCCLRSVLWLPLLEPALTTCEPPAAQTPIHNVPYRLAEATAALHNYPLRLPPLTRSHDPISASLPPSSCPPCLCCLQTHAAPAATPGPSCLQQKAPAAVRTLRAS